MEINIFKFENSLTKIELTRKNVLNVPQEPGIYIYWKDAKIPQYVGKSISLKNRLLSYLSNPLEPKTREMVNGSNAFSYIRVGSELESLLLEAKLIRLLNPKYNIELKDDKNPLYIKITKDEFPLVLTARRKEENEKNLSFYGPFPSSTIVKKVLKMIRRTIPFSTHLPQKRVCLYSQIGLCHPCPSYINNINEEKERKYLSKVYLRNIRLIKNILDGKINNVYKKLQKEMEMFSRREDFENAARVRNQIKNIEYISQSVENPTEFIKNPNLLADIRNKEKEELEYIINHFFNARSIKRIECYDIAHLAGTNPTASMVTFVNGESDKNLYRRFRIDPKNGGNDIGSLLEVARRRFKHLTDPSVDETGWGRPDLMIIDGGKGQVSAFTEVFKDEDIPIIGLAKRFETFVIPIKDNMGTNFKLIKLKRGPLLALVQRIRNEAHRFARSYHHKLVNKQLIGNEP